VGDHVLWYSKGEKEDVGKFKSQRFRPYRVLPNNIALLVTVANFEPNPIIMNINKLKSYQFYNEDQLVTITPGSQQQGRLHYIAEPRYQVKMANCTTCGLT
jgi:hypothetical protein